MKISIASASASTKPSASAWSSESVLPSASALSSA